MRDEYPHEGAPNASPGVVRTERTERTRARHSPSDGDPTAKYAATNTAPRGLSEGLSLLTVIGGIALLVVALIRP